MVNRVTVFRYIAVDESITHAFQMLIINFLVWCLIAVGWAMVADLVTANGSVASLWKASLFFLACALWPLRIGAEASFARIDNQKFKFSQILSTDVIFSFAFCMAWIYLFATLLGLLIDWGMTYLILDAKTAAPGNFLRSPVTAKTIMRLYPVICLAAIITGTSRAFAPFVALDKKLGFGDALSEGKRLAQGVRMEIVFLYGMMFFPASVAFLLGAVAPSGRFPQNIPAYLVHTLAFAYAGAAWSHAYRQVVALEALENGELVTKRETTHTIR